MRRFVVLAVALFAITIANAAPPVRVLTQPKLPPRAAFDRLNLEVAWLATLPIEGHRDGIAAVQQIGNQLYIQLRDGNILACHPETGEVQWSRRVGTHYPIGRHLGIGNGVVFVIDGLTVHALEATTGVEKWTLDMPAVPSAPPAADNSMLYVPLSNGRVQSYRMPRDPNATLTKVEKAKANASPAYKIFNRTPLNQDDADKPLTKTAIDPRSTVIVGSGTRTASPTTIENRATTSVSVGTTRRGASRQLTDEEVRLVAARPTMVGSSSLHNFTLTNPPLINTVGVLFTGNVASTYTQRYDLEHPVFRYQLDAPLAHAPAGYGQYVYLAATDGTLNVVDQSRGAIMWRYPTSSRIMSSPIATEDSLFLTTENRGITKLDRMTGQVMWSQPAAERFLAVNSRFVYASNRLGKLLVVDREVGTVLGDLCMAEFNVVYVNGQTDRVMLAGHDGSLVCLRDCGQKTPIQLLPTAPAPMAKNGDKKPGTEK